MNMKKVLAAAVICGLVVFCIFAADARAKSCKADAEGNCPTKKILEKIGVSRGICAVLGDTKCELALKLARETDLLIYVQLQNDEDVEKVRPVAAAGGTFWKWMALEDGVLYAMIGEQEQKDPVTKQRRKSHGWPWNPLSKGFNQPENPWGFGRNLLAIEPKSKKVLWHYYEKDKIDGRAVKVCAKVGIGRKAGHQKPCYYRNFQKNFLENVNS